MKSKFIKALITCLIVCMIGAGGYYGYKKYAGSKTVATTQSYMTVTARKMNLSVGVQGTGPAYAAVSRNVASSNSGTLSDLNVNVGDTVTEGQQLFTVSYVQGKETYVETVTSPINGIITAENNASGDNVQSGKPVLTVEDTSSMDINVAVDELDIDKVQVGQKAEITFDAINDKTFSGTVKAISPVGTSTNDVTTYNVTVSIDNPTGIRIGMNANVNIDVASKDDALVIPAEALIERNGKDYVMVSDSEANAANGNIQETSGGNQGTGANQKSGGAANKSGQNGQYGGNGSMRNKFLGQGRLVEIQIGLENENYIEVTQGLTEGEKVLVQLPQVNSNTTNTRGGLGGFGGGFGGGMGGSFGGNRNQSSKSSGKNN